MTPTATSPVEAADRVSRLDALRGFALLGIMFVNMTWFTGFAVLGAEQRADLGTAAIDAVTYWGVHFAVDGKFWSLFALLFGVGVALQCERAERRGGGRAFAGLFARRMAILLVIGLAHAILLWFGDIVSIYAVVGFAVLLFLRSSQQALLRWAFVLLLSPILVTGCWLAIDMATSAAGAAGAPRADPGHGPAALLVSFGSGSYAEAFRANWAFLVERWFLAIYTSRPLTLLGMFLLGLYAGRRGIVREPREHRPLLRRVVFWGLVIGVPANALVASMPVPLRPPSGLGWLIGSVRTIGTPALCLAYAGAVTLALDSPFARRLVVAPLAVVGRLSLTNYVLQSVVGIVVFYGYGLGQWGRAGVTWSLAFIAVIFGVQILASGWWLHRFDYGPLEWVWRCLTYRRRLPLRRPRARVAVGVGR